MVFQTKPNSKCLTTPPDSEMIGADIVKDCTAETLTVKTTFDGEETAKICKSNLETYTLEEVIVTYGTMDEDAKDRLIPVQAVKLSEQPTCGRDPGGPNLNCPDSLASAEEPSCVGADADPKCCKPTDAQNTPYKKEQCMSAVVHKPHRDKDSDDVYLVEVDMSVIHEASKVQSDCHFDSENDTDKSVEPLICVEMVDHVGCTSPNEKGEEAPGPGKHKGCSAEEAPCTELSHHVRTTNGDPLSHIKKATIETCTCEKSKR